MSNLNFLSTDAKLQADSAWSRDNYEGARHSRNIATTLNIYGFIIGIVGWGAVILLVVIHAAAAVVGAAEVSNNLHSSSSSYYS